MFIKPRKLEPSKHREDENKSTNKLQIRLEKYQNLVFSEVEQSDWLSGSLSNVIFTTLDGKYKAKQNGGGPHKCM